MLLSARCDAFWFRQWRAARYSVSSSLSSHHRNHHSPDSYEWVQQIHKCTGWCPMNHEVCEKSTLYSSLSVIWIKCNLWCVLKLLTSSDLEHRRMTFAIGLRNQFLCFVWKLSDCTINLRSFELASENVNSMTNRILIIVILFWKNFVAILEAVWKIDTISWGSRVVLSSRELSKTFAYFTQLTL